MNRYRFCKFLLVVAVALGVAGCGSSKSNQTLTPISPHLPPTAPNQWTWSSGPHTPDQTGDYGKMGAPAPGNVPPSRSLAASWTDPEGNLWLFGGEGTVGVPAKFVSVNPPGVAGETPDLNDLWEFKPSTNQWTWVSGSDSPGQQGVYGTKGVASANSVPGARQAAATWTDAQGNLWLFGGQWLIFTPYLVVYAGQGDLNDLWKFSPATGKWTWVNGPNQEAQRGVYGTKGVAAPGNVPGARSGAVTWVDSVGDFWLFGGTGLDENGSEGGLNDLWEYSPAMNEWTWMGGSDTVDQTGVYGTEGTASSGNVPGSRYGAVSWNDPEGNFWLFGGWNDNGALNDLWKFSNGKWTWMGGSQANNQPGAYGTQGAADSGNAPPSRREAAGWLGPDGDLWLFGGQGINAVSFNDLWKYDPKGNEWTWVAGSNQPCSAGAYGTQGTPSAENVPTARSSSAAWSDKSGNFWLFGGIQECSGPQGPIEVQVYNDLWEYQP